MTKPLDHLPKWHERSLIWETARPYLYFRTTPDNRIIAGGKDEPLTDPERRDIRVLSQGQRLLEELEALFPEIRESKRNIHGEPSSVQPGTDCPIWARIQSIPTAISLKAMAETARSTA